MLTNYYTLTYLCSSLKSQLAARQISAAFSQEKEQLVLQLSDLDDALLVSTERTANTLYLRPNFSRARANSADVLKGCVDQVIKEITMHPVDRVIMFHFESGTRMDVRFFGAKANVVLVDKDETIFDAFKDAKNLVGTRVEYRTGEIVYDVDALRRRFTKPQLATLGTILKEEFPTLGTTLAKEVLHRAQLPSNVGAMSVTEEQIQSMQLALSNVLSDLATPKARLYFQDDGAMNKTASAFSIIPLFHLGGLREEVFDNVHEAIRVFLSGRRRQEDIGDQKKSMIGKLSQKLQKARRSSAAIEDDLKNAERAEEYQRFGELLMSHLTEAKKGDKTLTTNDHLDVVEIPLSKELSPVQNAQKYFEKAKRSRSAQEQASGRLREMRTSIAPAEQLLEELEKVRTKDELKEFITKHKNELEEFGIGPKSEIKEHLPFRIFTVDGGFEVWAGKSSKNNDELTMKFAKPNDLWFHARGAAGSHVVLKVNTGKGEPSKKAREQAASIAAYYSKMKNAKQVPVAMTEKKFVRKPKGAAPGSVAVEREKVIFAEPALPAAKNQF
ncbi:MAG: NFACT family protein [bacterium]